MLMLGLVVFCTQSALAQSRLEPNRSSQRVAPVQHQDNAASIPAHQVQQPSLLLQQPVMKKAPLRIVPFLGGQSIKEAMPGLFAPAGTHMFYFGGPVISNIHLVQVLYGTGNYLSNVSSTVAPSVASFFNDLPQSSYFDLLAEYSTQGVVPSDAGPSSNQSIGHGFFDGQFTITPSTANNGATITDSQIQSELLAQVAAGHLPAPVLDTQGNSNTIYMVYFPAGKTISLAPGIASCVRGGFCAYHNSTTATFGSRSLLYGVIPDMQPPSACSTGCGSTIPFDNVTIVTSHEISEAVTDANVGQASSVARPLAWFDPNTGAEIGDVCAGLPATITANSNTYSVQQEWSNLQDMCTGAPLTFSFGSPFATTTPGTKFDLVVTASPNYRGTVHFSSSDSAAVLPPDYTFTFADAGVHNFLAALNTTGSQSITINDTQLPFTGTATWQVQSAAGAARFLVAAPKNANAGSPVSIAITAVDNVFNPTSNYNGTVHFTSSDAAAVLPPDTQVVNGTATFLATLNTAAAGQTVTISDVGTPSITGQASLNVLAPAANSTATTLTATPNPSTYGQGVLYAATVTGGTPPLGGSVTINSDFGAPLDATGHAQTTLFLSPGTHTFFADYSGSNAGAPSSSAPFTAVINPAPTSVNLTASQSAGNFGDAVIFTATVSSPLTGSLVTAIPQSGSITLNDNGTPFAILAAPAINSPAGTSFTTSQLTTGQHSITATFSGNTGFGAATSAPLTQVVNPAGSPDLSLTANNTSATVLAGQAATLVVDIKSLNGFTGVIKLSCGNLPAFATCAFSPSIQFLVTAETLPVALNLKTAGPNAALLSPALPTRNHGNPGLWAMLSLGACGIFLIGGFRKRSYLRSSSMIALMMLGAITGCGGGGGPKTAFPNPTPVPQVTPAGTTTFQVIATATPASGPTTTITRQLNLTLTVQQ